MTDAREEQEDTWPLPNYNPGSPRHLHALGVIAVTYAGFQRSIDSLYAFHPRQQKLPDELIELYYFSLGEEKRIDAVRKVFDAYGKSEVVKAAINNVLSYFRWCKHTRDQILHAERYPASFGGDPDTLYLTKRLSKQSPDSGHMSFKLDELRSIADKMRVGIVQSATIHIHLRVRDVPLVSVRRVVESYESFVIQGWRA
jgi:hypothetical protein